MNNLSKEIEALKSKDKSLSYIEATLVIAKKYDLDEEELPKLLHKNIIDKLKVEFIERNLVKGVDRFNKLSPELLKGEAVE